MDELVNYEFRVVDEVPVASVQNPVAGSTVFFVRIPNEDRGRLFVSSKDGTEVVPFGNESNYIKSGLFMPDVTDPNSVGTEQFFLNIEGSKRGDAITINPNQVVHQGTQINAYFDLDGSASIQVINDGTPGNTLSANIPWTYTWVKANPLPTP